MTWLKEHRIQDRSGLVRLRVLGCLFLLFVILASPTASGQGVGWGQVVESAKRAVVWILAKLNGEFSCGSGVLISPDGLILTAAHVLEGATEITVVVEEKREYRAELVKIEEKADVALLKISVTGVFWLSLGDSDELTYEEEIRVLGYPLPEHGVGCISVAGRFQGFRVKQDVKFLQHDAPTEAGHSGGPVINRKMEVVGVHLGFIKGEHSAYALAVAINSVKHLVGPVVDSRAPSPPAVRKPLVLLDQTRNYGVGPYAYYSTRTSEWFGTTELVRILTAQGFVVENLDKWPITRGQLNEASVVVIFGPEYGFKPSEIEVLVDFVADGGGLFVGFQQMKLESDSQWGTRPIARAFGADFRVGGNIADDKENYKGRVNIIKITRFEKHLITNGVSALWFQGAAVVPPKNATILAWSSPYSWFDRMIYSEYWGNGRRDRDPITGILEEPGPFPVLAAFEYGKGRIVIAGDSSFMMNCWIDELDAQKLAINIVAWLARKSG